MPLISVIIPCLNEAVTLPETLASLQALKQQGVELIVVDGGSSDNTVALATPLVDKMLIAPAGRSNQLNKGAEVAQGVLLVFLHADTRLPADAHVLLLGAANSETCWGRFDVRLDGQQWAFRLIEKLMNWRSCLTGIVTGDQAIFVSKALFEEVGGYPPIALMEDVAISKLLKKRSRPVCFHSAVITSSRRWQQNGILRTILLMWQLRLAYFFNVEPDVLAKKYRANQE
ncbi:MAG: TIGR04283 family arsenosugar biosynthesis glycosyltransferase [Cycloclasticus sp.]